MTKNEIIRMAKEAGQADGTTPLERSIVIYAAKSSLFLEKFAALIAAAEREACAKVCEVEATVIVTNASEQYQEGRSMGAAVCVAAIRARGEK